MKPKLNYKFQTVASRADMKWHFKQKGQWGKAKKRNWRAAYIDMVDDVLAGKKTAAEREGVLNSLHTTIVMLCDEYAWYKNPCVIKIKDQDFVDKIMSIVLKDTVVNVSVPFEHVILDFDNGVHIKNEKLDGILLTYKNYHIRAEEHAEAFPQLGPLSRYPEEDPDAMKLRVNTLYSHVDENGGKPRIAYTDTVENLAKIIVTGDEFGTCDEEQQFMTEQGISMKKESVIEFIIKLFVYLSAHPENLKETDAITHRGVDKKPTPIRTFTPVNIFKHTKKAPHYRNLRHEKYYRGQWQDWMPGTRWIPVNMKSYEVDE